MSANYSTTSKTNSAISRDLIENSTNAKLRKRVQQPVIKTFTTPTYKSEQINTKISYIKGVNHISICFNPNLSMVCVPYVINLPKELLKSFLII
jgi:hypothetical protein